uniref:Uncharacterized protein n=1 Tax=Anopheles arabiensis TaxID=7173 RepID=A0A182IGN8_ANOAR
MVAGRDLRSRSRCIYSRTS